MTSVMDIVMEVKSGSPILQVVDRIWDLRIPASKAVFGEDPEYLWDADIGEQ